MIRFIIVQIECPVLYTVSFANFKLLINTNKFSFSLLSFHRLKTFHRQLFPSSLPLKIGCHGSLRFIYSLAENFLEILKVIFSHFTLSGRKKDRSSGEQKAGEKQWLGVKKGGKEDAAKKFLLSLNFNFLQLFFSYLSL